MIEDWSRSDKQAMGDAIRVLQTALVDAAADVAAMRERCAMACEMLYGGKSHKVSENSDRYAVQDETTSACAEKIRALPLKES